MNIQLPRAVNPGLPGLYSVAMDSVHQQFPDLLRAHIIKLRSWTAGSLSLVPHPILTHKKSPNNVDH